MWIQQVKEGRKSAIRHVTKLGTVPSSSDHLDCWILKFLQWIGERLLPVTYWDIHVSIDEKLNSKELGKRIISSQLERGHPFGVTSVCFYCCNATKTSEKSPSIILHIPVPLPQIIHIQSSSVTIEAGSREIREVNIRIHLLQVQVLGHHPAKSGDHKLADTIWHWRPQGRKARRPVVELRNHLDKAWLKCCHGGKRKANSSKTTGQWLAFAFQLSRCEIVYNNINILYISWAIVRNNEIYWCTEYWIIRRWIYEFWYVNALFSKWTALFKENCKIANAHPQAWSLPHQQNPRCDQWWTWWQQAPGDSRPNVPCPGCSSSVAVPTKSSHHEKLGVPKTEEAKGSK